MASLHFSVSIKSSFRRNPFLSFALLALLSSAKLLSQTTGTGVLSGDVTDASGAAIRTATLTVINQDTLEERHLTLNSVGYFTAPLLQPGRYQVVVISPGFSQAVFKDIAVAVAASQTLHIHLTAGSSQQIDVEGSASSTGPPANLGSVTGRESVAGLPLAARNYTQILGLNTGVAAEVSDASALGRGNTSYAAGTGGFSSNGAATNDNNFQMDGVDVNDIQGSGSLSRGIPVPSPDAIAEFRVSTQPYDASQGRNSGASINIVTRSGSPSLHGSLFEYFRNDALNANSYFRNATLQPRPSLKQNQFGGTLGGHLFTPAILGFASYQETRQSNGLDASCSSSVALPPLTNDRSAAGLGAVFQGQRGYFQNAFGGVGPAIAANGSNISPVALALLQLNNPDGSFLIPTPQSIVSTTGNFDARGFSTFSLACPYTEHQGVATLDWQLNPRHHLSAHTFASNSDTLGTLPTPLLGGSGLPSSPYTVTDGFRTLALIDTWAATPNILNELRFGFSRLQGRYIQQYPFSFSTIGATVPSFDDAYPLMTIAGASIGGGGNRLAGATNTYILQDVIAYTHRRHFFHIGAGFERIQDNQPFIDFYGATLFLSFADLLLGQNATQNGTAAVCAFVGCGAGYSDIAYAQDIPGKVQREYRVLSDHLYLQDDLRLSPRLTLNLGLRYERLGDLADRLGHNTSFFPALADTAPPSTGTLQGYVVPKNYTGPVPSGVTRLSNNYGLDGAEQNTFQPRAGFAWQLPRSDRLTLRAGAGIFRSRITADPYDQSVITPPFARQRQYQGPDPVTASLSLAQPLPAFTQTLPSFAPYCGAIASTCTEAPVFNGLSPAAIPPLYQRYNLDLETQLARSLSFDIGYVGAQGHHLLTRVYINQAALATPSSPVHGLTSTTLANLAVRVPQPGFTVNNLSQFQTSGSSFYNSLQSSLHLRTNHHQEFLLAYTWARDLSNVYDGTTSLHGGTLLGDQTNRASTYGPDLFLREHRLVASYVLQLPNPHGEALRRIIGAWQLSGVAVAQSGHSLTATYQNQFSAYGILNDRAHLTPRCSANLSSPAQTRLTHWFNTTCFVPPPVIGNDGVATAFGDAPIGSLRGPRQANLDTSVERLFPIGDATSLKLRVEAYNLFNHAQFVDPVTELSSPSFGQVLSTTVNPRIVQVAVRLSF